MLWKAIEGPSLYRVYGLVKSLSFYDGEGKDDWIWIALSISFVPSQNDFHIFFIVPSFISRTSPSL